MTVLAELVTGLAHPTGLLPDVGEMLHAFGPWVLVGIGIIIFIESGVLFPFLPGDSLLVTAALTAVPLGIQPWHVLAVAIPAAIAGDQVGYWLGHKFGRRLFKDDARILKTSHLDETERFFAKYGGPSLIVGRFVPIVRTYVPLVAGTAKLPYPRFFAWNVTGAVLWVASMVAVGALLGGIPFIVENIDMLMIAAILISVVPVAAAVLWKRLRRRSAPLPVADPAHPE